MDILFGDFVRVCMRSISLEELLLKQLSPVPLFEAGVLRSSTSSRIMSASRFLFSTMLFFRAISLESSSWYFFKFGKITSVASDWSESVMMLKLFYEILTYCESWSQKKCFKLKPWETLFEVQWGSKSKNSLVSGIQMVQNSSFLQWSIIQDMYWLAK